MPASPPPIPPDEFDQRRRRAGAEAARRGLDGLIVWGRGGTLDSFSDVHYLTNHYSPLVWVPPLPGVLTGCEHAGVVISADGAASLLVTEFCSEEVRIEEIRRNADLASELVATVREQGLVGGRVGIVGEEVFPYAIAEILRNAYPHLRLEPADDLSAALRFHLSDNEIRMLQYAGAVGLHIYRTFTEAVSPGATEGDAVAAGIGQAARIAGCAHWSFLSASGPDAGSLARSSFPAWNPSYRYRVGDVVHADCYGFAHGYVYDLARTIVVGQAASNRQARVIQSTRDACREMANTLRRGVTCRELHLVGTAALTDAGLKPLSAAYGHGIGAGFFRPYITPNGTDADRPFEPPCGISIELFATDGNGHYAYHEDNYVLLDDGLICLTDPQPPSR